uniref:EF-hand domain-containing protein n=1 Tax=Araucaria cunninghamii TaxID=56994 RepID=A0A0D6QY05_ARACU
MVMGLPWFADRKKWPAKSPRPQSKRFNVFSSKSRPPSSSSKKSSSHARQGSSMGKNVNFSGCGDLKNCPLPGAAELEYVFKKFDGNADGKISSSELCDVMRLLGHDPSEEELRLMMAEADSDGDGYVDFSEFVALNTNGVGSVESLEDLKDAFKIFDMDGNGFISADELHNVLRRLGESCSLAECRNMIEVVDVDGDGHVSFDEFLAMMTTPIAN